MFYLFNLLDVEMYNHSFQWWSVWHLNLNKLFKQIYNLSISPWIEKIYIKLEKWIVKYRVWSSYVLLKWFIYNFKIVVPYLKIVSIHTVIMHLGNQILKSNIWSEIFIMINYEQNFYVLMNRQFVSEQVNLEQIAIDCCQQTINSLSCPGWR